MINVKIYCCREHQDYDNVYNTIRETLDEKGAEYDIKRISRQEEICHSRIQAQPHIVINRQVVYVGYCPKKDEVLQVLKIMQLLK